MPDERRTNRRLLTPGLTSRLADDSSAFFVVVDDVSKHGVGVSQVPAGFDELVHRCFAVISAPLEDFSLVLQPRWVQGTGRDRAKRVGFHIDDPPREWVAFVDSLKARAGARPPREASRHRILGLMAVLTDGNTRYLGVVEDLSAQGLCVTRVPADFDETAAISSAVVRSPTGDVQVSLRPCWIRSTNRGMYKTIGFQIRNPPAGWLGLINELEKSGGRLGFLILAEDEEVAPAKS